MRLDDLSQGAYREGSPIPSDHGISPLWKSARPCVTQLIGPPKFATFNGPRPMSQFTSIPRPDRSRKRLNLGDERGTAMDPIGLPRLLFLVLAFLCQGEATWATQDPQAVSSQDADPFESVLREYQEILGWLPLQEHTKAREMLAQTGDPRALQVLLESYKSPHKFEVPARHLIAGICYRYLGNETFADQWDAWRTECDEDRDGYLWFRALTVLYEVRGEAPLVEILGSKASHFQKSAALQALAFHRSQVLPGWIRQLCADLPRKDDARLVLLGAMGVALRSQPISKTNDGLWEAAEAYAMLLGEDHKLSHRAKLTIARHLGLYLGSKRLWFEPDSWLNKIKATRATGSLPRSSGGDESYVGSSSFFGLEGTGERTAYVIDMSDSMCTLIDPALLPKGPVTGVPTPKRKKGDPPTADDINWGRVKTRFDLAREHLKVSLRRLDEDAYFTMIYFGSQADLFRSTDGMVKATRTNVKKALDELNSIKMGPPIEGRPNGTLRGLTNLHGGLRRAFQVRKKGLADEDEFIDKKAILDGADTIFLLSDGVPSWDDWDMPDKNHRNLPTGDPETLERTPDSDSVHYFGPYVFQTHLLDDLTRLTLFRDVEIHCVGIGEANMGLLNRIAALGLGGKTHHFGSK